MRLSHDGDTLSLRTMYTIGEISEFLTLDHHIFLSKRLLNLVVERSDSNNMVGQKLQAFRAMTLNSLAIGV